MNFGFIKSSAVRELERIVAELQANLENNYKDSAQAARLRLKDRMDKLLADGKLSEKEYRKFSIIYTEYSVKMTGYHH